MAKEKEKEKIKPVRVQVFHNNKKAERKKICPLYLWKL